MAWLTGGMDVQPVSADINHLTGGRLAATKGSATLRELDESTAALTELGGEHLKTLRFEPPEGMPQSVILIAKVAPTPQRFPRRPGMATKRPIR